MTWGRRGRETLDMGTGVHGGIIGDTGVGRHHGIGDMVGRTRGQNTGYGGGKDSLGGER